MEALTDAGFFKGVLDLTTTEWCDEVVGGVLAAGQTRCEAAARCGIPQVVSVGAMDMVNFGPFDTVPQKFAGRNLYKHNPTVTLMRTTAEENREVGEKLAEKLNLAFGKTALLLPLKGVSAIDAEGQPFYGPKEDQVLFQTLRDGVNRDAVEIMELDYNINDKEFAVCAAEKLMELMKTVAKNKLLLGAVIPLLPLVGTHAQDKAKESAPNILFIMSDDHAEKAISAYGSEFSRLAPTPNIDRIANEGALFEANYCCNSLSGPSRAAVMSGKYSHANGFMRNGNKFDGSQLLVQKIFRANGYQTALIGKWHLVTKPTGFDYWTILNDQGEYYNPDFITENDTVRIDGYVTDIITENDHRLAGTPRPEQAFLYDDEPQSRAPQLVACRTSLSSL